MPVYKTKDEATKDKKIWYFAVYYTDIFGNRKKYKSKKFATKEEAKKEEAAFITTKYKNTKSNLTVNDIFLEYCNYSKDRVKERTLQTYVDRIKLFVIPYFKNKKIDKITTKDIMMWQDEINNLKMKNGKLYSSKYKQSIYISFSTLFKYAADFYDINNRALKKVGNFKNKGEIDKKMSFLTYNEYIKFISYEKDIIYKTFFSLLYFTGARKGEAKALNWDDVNFNKKTININKTLTTKVKNKKWIIGSPKTKSSIREILMPDILVQQLKELKDYYMNFKEFNNRWFVFGAIEPLPDSTIDGHKNRICKLINKYIRIHDFRHSCASFCIDLGANIVYISQRLGHKNIEETLNTYSHLFPSTQQEILDKMNKKTKK